MMAIKMQANPWTKCEQVHKRLRTIYEKIEKNKTTTKNAIRRKVI